jgi:hypothetical protein
MKDTFLYAKHIKLAFLFCLLTFTGFSQRDTAAGKISSDIFDRITKGLKDFRLDTSAAPDDKITWKIIELRNLRGGFNINEAVDFKIEEDKQKNEMSKEELEKLSKFFKSGEGKKLLDNAVIWIYRQHFTYRELKQLIKFYQTSAGQKLATEFPVIMIQSLKAAEMIKEIYTHKSK